MRQESREEPSWKARPRVSMLAPCYTVLHCVLHLRLPRRSRPRQPAERRSLGPSGSRDRLSFTGHYSRLRENEQRVPTGVWYGGAGWGLIAAIEADMLFPCMIQKVMCLSWRV